MEKDSNSILSDSDQSPLQNHLSDNHQLHPLDHCFSPQTTPPRLSIDSTWSPLHRPVVFPHCVASVHCHKNNSINAIVVMKSRRIVLTGSDSWRIRAWRLSDCGVVGHIKASCGGVRSMLLARGNMLFTSHQDHKIRLWNVGSRRRAAYDYDDKFHPKKITTLPKPIGSINKFLLFSKASVVCQQQQQRRQQQHKDVISCMGYYHAEDILYTGSWDKTIKAWKVSEGRCIDSFMAHEENINALVVNQQDGCLFTGSADGMVKIWRRAYGGSTHSLTMTLKFDQLSPINALALSVSSSNGTYLYSGSSDGCTNVWVKDKVSCRYNHGGFLEGHRFAVLCLVALDNLVISGSEDTTIRVWRRAGEEGRLLYHECLVILEGHRGPVKCVNTCLEKDNHKVSEALFIYSASSDQTFKVWRVKVMPEMMNDTNPIGASSYTEDDDGSGTWNSNSLEFEMSPVLSPLWVEKKLQLGI